MSSVDVEREGWAGTVGGGAWEDYFGVEREGRQTMEKGEEGDEQVILDYGAVESELMVEEKEEEEVVVGFESGWDRLENWWEARVKGEMIEWTGVKKGSVLAWKVSFFSFLCFAFFFWCC